MDAPVSIIILTQNEAENLPRCLKALAGLRDIVVLDSGSTDRTLEIARTFGARVYEHPFESFAQQRNWALDQCEPVSEWVLFLDADEVATPELRQALQRSIESADNRVAGFYCCYKTMLGTRWLKRCDSFPKWQFRVLRRGRARFCDSGHGQKEGEVDGEIRYIHEPYLHYAFSKGWKEWWVKHDYYSTREAADRLDRAISWRELFAPDPSRRNRALKPLMSRVPGWPLWRFLHMYVLKGGFLEGREALLYCRSMARYEYLIRVKMAEMRRAQVVR